MEIVRLDEETMECSLTPEDVRQKGISLDKVTYTSPVIRSLIHDLTEQLIRKHMFGSNSAPSVACEVIPLNDGGLDFIFSTGGYTDDLDPRYSVFASVDDSNPSNDHIEPEDTSSDTIGDILHSIIDGNLFNEADEKFIIHHESKEKGSHDSWSESIFEFESLTDVIKAFSKINPEIETKLGIYRSSADVYIVLVYFSDNFGVSIPYIQDLLTDFGIMRELNSGSDLYIKEHCEEIFPLMPLNTFKNYFVKH